MTMTADTPDTKELKDGRVVAIAGPVVDVEFPPDALPEIDFAIQFEAELEGETIGGTSTEGFPAAVSSANVVAPARQITRSAAFISRSMAKRNGSTLASRPAAR